MSSFNSLTTGINEIFDNVNYASKNLYTVEISNFNFTSEVLNSNEDLSEYLKFQSPSISFKGESLDLIRNDVTKNFQLSDDGNSFKWTNELSITWRERDDWCVKKYHEAWINLIYNRKNDRYQSVDSFTLSKLYKVITVTLPKSTTNPDAKRIIKFYDVIPRNLGDLDLKWGTSADNVEHNITYYVKSWNWVNE